MNTVFAALFRSRLKSSLVTLMLSVAICSQAQLANSGWAKFRGGPQNQGISTGSGTLGSLSFFSPLVDSNLSSPSIGLNGLVYVASGQSIVAVDGTTGAIKWTTDTHSAVYSSPAVGANGVLYCCGSNALLALDGATGSQLWSYPVAGFVVGSPAIGSDGAVYFGDVGSDSLSGHIYAVMPSGITKWRIQTAAIVSSPAISSDGSIYIGSCDFRIYSLNPADGSTIQSFVTNGPVQSAPAIAPDGTVYVYSGDGVLYALDSSLGLKWTFNIGGGISYVPSYVSSPAIGPDGSVYVGSTDGKLYAVSGTGKLSWTFQVAPVGVAVVGIQSSVAVGSDGTIYLGPADSSVYALSPTGTVTWQTQVQNSNQTSPALGANGMLYVSASTGLAAFKNITPISVSLLPAAITGGTSSVGTVTLSSPAPLSGVQVNLATSDPSVKVPATVFVAGGQSSATFSVTTLPVGASASVAVSASLNAVTVTGMLSVNSPVLASIVPDKSQYVGGNSGQVTLTISGPAPDGGVLIHLSSDSAVLTIPASLTIAAGASSASVAFQTTGVSVSSTATIAATLSGSTINSPIKVTPASLLSIEFDQSFVVGPASISAIVALNGMAPSGGVAVALTSASNKVSLPKSVKILGGSSSTTVLIPVSAVTLNTVIPIKATLNKVAVSASFTDEPLLITSLVLNPTSVGGGSSVTGTVTLNGVVGSTTTNIKLKSSSPKASVPASVPVAKGQSSATFTVSTLAVGATTTAALSATLGAGTKSAILTIRPPSLASLSLSQTTVVGGGQVTGTVTLDGNAGSGGAVVAISSASRDLTIPATVTVPAGKSTATFSIQTAGVSVTSVATILCKLGSVSQSAALTLTASALDTLTVSPSDISGGVKPTGVVRLTGPAPLAGTSVALASDNAAATVPGRVLIPSGQTSTTFLVTTYAVDSKTTVTISATADKTLSTTIQLYVAWLAFLTVSPGTVFGGSSATGTIYLSGPAPSGGMRIALSASDPTVGLPSTVNVGPGQTRAAFTITTAFSFSPLSVTITAQSNVSSLATAILKVR